MTSGTAGGQNLGFSIAVEGDIVVVGAPGGAGFATVFRRFDGGTPGDPSDDTWFELQILTGSTTTLGDQFGYSVGISGDRIVVGARRDDSQTFDEGAAFVFEWNGVSWVETQRLPGSGANHLSGAAIDIEGDRILVGSENGGVQAWAFDSGGAQWVETQTLTGVGGLFGYTVQVEGDVCAVGAPTEGGVFAGQGAVYLYRLDDLGTPTLLDDQWLPAGKLTAPQPETFGQFGVSVSISGDLILVGSNLANPFGNDSGAAFLFEPIFPGGPWQLAGNILPSDGAPSDLFGNRVVIDGDRMAISANRDDDAGQDGGAVYIFEKLGAEWIETEQVRIGDASPSDSFGVGLVLQGKRLLVGASGYDDFGADQGGTFLFELSRGDFGLFGFGDGSAGSCPCTDSIAVLEQGCVNTTGYGVRIAPIGSTSVAAQDLSIAASGLPSLNLAYLFYSQSTQASPPFIGNGLLVLSPPLGRLQSGFADPEGFRIWTSPLGGLWGPGDTRYFQVWYRDGTSTCGSSFNTSNGLRVTFGN